MHVLIISEYFPPESKGGGEISAFLLAKELAKHCKIDVLTSYFNGKRKEKLNGITIHRLLETGKDPTSFKDQLKRQKFESSLIKTLEKIHFKYDIIHCMNISSIVAIKAKINKKFILHVNSPVLFCPKATLMYKDKELCEKKCSRLTYFDCYINSSLLGKMPLQSYLKYNLAAILYFRKKFENYQQLMKKFDFYMPISSYMKKRLLMAGIKKNVEVIYNINEYEKFIKLKTPKNKTRKILYLGEYSKPKGPHLILEALKSIDNYDTNFYGSGVLKKYFKEQIQKHKLNVKIHNKLPYDKIPEIIQKHDIVIFPSLVGEAFGRVPLEACAAGKTVIASNIGGVPDIIENGRTGYLFEPENIEQLASILRKKKLLDPNKVRENTVKKFSNEESVKKVIKIYSTLINLKGSD